MGSLFSIFNIWKPVLPKQHGSSVWVLLPLITGGLLAGGGGISLSITIAIACGWFWLAPARIIIKNRSAGKASTPRVAFWFFIYLIGLYYMASITLRVAPQLVYIYVSLGFFALLSLRFSIADFKGHFYQIVGILLLSTLSLLSAWGCGRGLQPINYGFWLLVLLFLLERNIGVINLSLSIRSGLLPQPSSLRLNFFISLISITLSFLSASYFAIPAIKLISFAPGLLLNLFFIFKPPPSLRQLGFSELFIAILFGVIVVLL